MKNTDYLLLLTTRGGSVTKFSRDAVGWVEISPAGVRRRCTAEQVLNHLLPALVLGDAFVSTKVKLKRGRRFNPRIERMRKRSTVPRTG
jgi:hypothetical protein